MSYKPSKELRVSIEVAIQNIASSGGSVEWWKRFWALVGMMIGEAQAEVVKGLEPVLAVEGETPYVPGRALLGSVRDHESACLTQIALEQRKGDVDSSLIALLSNSLLLSRQHQDLLKEISEKVPTSVVLARLQNILDRLLADEKAVTAVEDLIRLLKRDEEEKDNG